MPESAKSSETDVPGEGGGRFARLLIARELRWLYFSLVLLLAVFGLGLVGVAVERLDVYLSFSPQDRAFEGSETLSQILSYSGVGTLFILSSIGIWQVRKYLNRLQYAAVERIRSVELRSFAEDDFERYDEVRRLREEKARADFNRNLDAHVVVHSLEFRDVLMFPNARWELQRGVNVLLGRNGYGKTLMLRALAAALQRDEDAMEAFFSVQPLGSEPGIELIVERDGELEKVRRSPIRFVESIGKVPVLAIPDSRFLDRSQLTITPLESDVTDLREYGAHHFLRQHPYGEVLQALLYEMCLDFWEHGQTFDLANFNFLRFCASRLTGSDFRFHSIKRSGRTGFEILVTTEGNEQPIPIQHSSQGTLSILSIFGLIRSFVRSLSMRHDGGLAENGSAIVLIDEADAHLHPVWQQRVPAILRDLFPNVQFILTAHSPLFVAGCWRREAAVLRKLSADDNAPGYTVEQLDTDFVGVTSADLYQQIFEIEELDETYLEYSAKATLRQGNTERLAALTQKQSKGKELSDEEKSEMRRLIEENRRIRRAVDRRREREAQEAPEVRIAELESQVLQLKSTLKEHEGVSGV